MVMVKIKEWGYLKVGWFRIFFYLFSAKYWIYLGVPKEKCIINPTTTPALILHRPVGTDYTLTTAVHCPTIRWGELNSLHYSKTNGRNGLMSTLKRISQKSWIILNHTGWRWRLKLDIKLKPYNRKMLQNTECETKQQIDWDWLRARNHPWKERPIYTTTERSDRTEK